MRDLGKRGQLAIFVIIALVIVVGIVLFFFFRGNVTNVFAGAFSPNAFLKDCATKEINPDLERLAKQGGYSNPEAFKLFNGEKHTYLCYTSENFKTCVVQQPMIKAHFEQELNSIVKSKADQCMRDLIEEYKKRGYGASVTGVNSKTSFVPGNVLVSFNNSLTVTKEASETFPGFEVKVESNMYDLIFIAQSIVDYESKFGNSATELYMQYYPNLKIEKIKLSDGTTIYKLSNVITKEEFDFASRSLAWGAGYGTDK